MNLSSLFIFASCFVLGYIWGYVTRREQEHARNHAQIVKTLAKIEQILASSSKTQ